MNVLGLHVGHDSSAALVRDGRVVADVAEERFVRIKHYCGLPGRALEYCLASQNLSMKDIDVIAIPAAGSVPDLNHLLRLTGGRRERSTGKRQALDFAKAVLRKPGIKPPLYMKTFPVSPRTEIVHVDHHLAHAASAYYTNGVAEKQLIVTIDGAGDDVSFGIWRGEAGRIERLEVFPTSGSLGWFYSNVTEALGWWHGDGEGKTMGLAPYGDPSGCEGVLDEFCPRYEAGRLTRPHDFGRSFYWNESGAIQWHFDQAAAIRDLVRRHGRTNIAAEAQRVLEEQVKSVVFPWMEREQTRNLTASGGVMLNVKLNQRLWDSGKIAHHHTYPNPGDSGLAVGAALQAYYAAEPNARIYPVEDVNWGPEYSVEEIEETLKLRRLQFRRVDDVESYAADRLAAGKILGWFQGRMESGPRALGSRSILMSANRARA